VLSNKSWGKEGVVIKLKLVEILTFFCKTTTSANILVLESKTRPHSTSSAVGKRAHQSVTGFSLVLCLTDP